MSIESEVQSLYEAYPYPSRKKHSLKDIRDYPLWLVKLTGESDPNFFRGKRVLEVGCGTGELACGLALNGAIVDAIDLSSASIARANALKQQLKLDNVSFGQKSVFALEELGTTKTDKPSTQSLGTTTVVAGFDVVISLGVLHHTSDARKAFGVCARQLKPGGLLLVGLYSSFGRWRHRVKRLLVKLFAGNDVQKRLRVASVLFFGGKMPKKGPIWLADKFGQPHESYHSIEEVERWCRQNHLVPVAWDPPLSKPSLALQLEWVLSRKNAFFCVGARKKV